jgi:hypothetical protein
VQAYECSFGGTSKDGNKEVKEISNFYERPGKLSAKYGKPFSSYELL